MSVGIELENERMNQINDYLLIFVKNSKVLCSFNRYPAC